MRSKRNQRATYFFILAFAGLATAWWFNALAVMHAGDYIKDGFTSNVDWVYSLDLLITGVAAMSFIIVEGRRQKMRHLWAYVLVSLITAVAFAFPLFLAMRELHLRKVWLAGGRIDTYEFDKHRVDVWVPKDVSATTPVLVMHDGKNVFFEEFSTHGPTWGVLDAIRDGRIRAEHKPLVIAVWGLSGETRNLELGPEDIYVNHPEVWQSLPSWMNPQEIVPMGNAYQALLATKILPELAAKYGVTLDPSRTAIAGSSMGGLSSLYGLAKYPDVWGTALCYSTHWPFGFETMVEKLTDLLPPAGRHRIWTDSGTLDIDAAYPPYHAMAVQRLEERGYRYEADYVGAIYPNTGHNEAWWAGRVEHPINWWLNPNEPRATKDQVMGR